MSNDSCAALNTTPTLLEQIQAHQDQVTLGMVLEYLKDVKNTAYQNGGFLLSFTWQMPDHLICAALENKWEPEINEFLNENGFNGGIVELGPGYMRWTGRVKKATTESLE